MKKINLLASLKSQKKGVGSGVGLRSISQRYGTYPHQMSRIPNTAFQSDLCQDPRISYDPSVCKHENYHTYSDPDPWTYH
jgi:hypothetical protein